MFSSKTSPQSRFGLQINSVSLEFEYEEATWDSTNKIICISELFSFFHEKKIVCAAGKNKI